MTEVELMVFRNHRKRFNDQSMTFGFYTTSGPSDSFKFDPDYY
jgi:hypothetical protein